MSYNLPPQLEDLRVFLPELVAEAEKKAPYAAALVTQSAGETISKSPADECSNPIPPRPGIRISALDGATFRSVATSRVEDRDPPAVLLGGWVYGRGFEPEVEQTGQVASRKRVIIVDAVGMDYHVFNTYFRDNPEYEVGDSAMAVRTGCGKSQTSRRVPNPQGQGLCSELAARPAARART